MCSIEGCNRAVLAKGLCSKHYNRLITTGTTDDGPRARMPMEERFWRRVSKTDTCWEWLGHKNAYGYGVINAGGRNGKAWFAHRYSWMIHNGEIPKSAAYHGTVIRHSCDNRSCVNPEHLLLGSQKDNVADMDSRGRRVSNPRRGSAHHNGGKTHCKHGHEFTPENTRVNSRGQRTCRACHNDRSKDAHKRKRGDMFGIQERKPKTHCPHGHEFTVENTYIRPDGHKECRICRAARVQKFKMKQRA